MKHLENNGISSRVYYPVPLHLQPCYKDLGYSRKMIPIAEKLSDKVLSLPVYPELKSEETDYIIEKVKDFYK